MLSGPDLGAGFLHQLSVEGDTDPRTFTYHAQDGGADAAGPPKGSLDVLDFVHPPSACMYGGPRCWHRRFRLPFADLPKVRLAYNRNRFVLQAMIDQAYAGVKTGHGRCPHRTGRPGHRPARRGGDPVVRRGFGRGLAAGSPRGAPGHRSRHDPRGSDPPWRAPRTIPHRARRAHGSGGWDWRAGCTGVPRNVREGGARRVVGANGPPRAPLLPPSSGASRSGCVSLAVRYRNHELKVTRPEYSLVRAAERGRNEPAIALATLVRELGPDHELLATLLRGSSLTEPQRASVRSLVHG